MPQPKPCKFAGCTEPKDLPAHFCYYHNLDRQFIDDQVVEARKRREVALADGGEPISRMKPEEWTAGHRWCSGCQSMVPLWYVSGSRCKACDSAAKYAAHIQKTYSISYSTYLDLYEFQGRRCFICGKQPKTLRLAVDHDHKTGQVRGLLCSGQRSCNHDVLGNISDLPMAQRLVIYLETPPFALMAAGLPLPEEGKPRPKYLTNAPPGWELLPGTTEIMRRLSDEALLKRATVCREGHYTDMDFWRYPDGHEGPWDIFHARPDDHDRACWAVRLRLARDKVLGKYLDSVDTGTEGLPEQPQEPISGPEPADWRNDPSWS